MKYRLATNEDFYSLDNKINYDLIKKYLRYCNNKIHCRQTSGTTKKKYSERPAETNRGRSRLRVSLVGKRVLRNNPMAKSGRRNKHSTNYPLKLNNKERLLAIKNIFKWLLTDKKIYLVKPDMESKTKELLENVEGNLKLQLQSNRLKIFFYKSNEMFSRCVNNIRNSICLDTNKRYFYELVKGFKTRILMITEDCFNILKEDYLL